MTLAYLLVLSFATWRLSRLVVNPEEAGPYDVLIRIRHWLGWRWDEQNELYFNAVGIWYQIARASSCMECNSIWFGLGFALLYIISPVVAIAIALPLALSGVTLVVEETLT